MTLQWKSAVAAAAAAAAAKAKAVTASVAASPATTPRVTVTSAEGSGRIARASSFSVPPPSPAPESTRQASEAVRVKARSVMADAIRGHGGSDAADAAPRLAAALEEGLFKAHNGDTGLVYRWVQPGSGWFYCNSCTHSCSLAGRSVCVLWHPFRQGLTYHATVQAQPGPRLNLTLPLLSCALCCSARLRTLISALKLPNAICPELISGELQPAEVTAMPPHMLALSSAARQEVGKGR